MVKVIIMIMMLAMAIMIIVIEEVIYYDTCNMKAKIKREAMKYMQQ